MGNLGPVTLSDMVGHDELLEKYTWLSAQMLNKWRAAGRVRYLHGKSGKIAYPIEDIHVALTLELRLDVPAPSETKATPPKSNKDDTPEVAEILRRLSLEKIFGKGNIPAEYLEPTTIDPTSSVSEVDQIKRRQIHDEVTMRTGRRKHSK
ncbi:hypothetical protein [Rhizobium sp. HT1-10]|uniref:hypothetical protein n=1 Tax=Rhizobium sp. HT1-10 TaxID=3111638 RepID=UPI003C20B59C